MASRKRTREDIIKLSHESLPKFNSNKQRYFQGNMADQRNSSSDKRKRGISIYGDNKLVGRIKNYLKLLSENSSLFDSANDTVENWILDELQKDFPEYKRKQKNVLKRSVTKAFEFIPDELINFLSESNDHADSIDSKDDEMDLDYEVNHNSMNKSLNKLYKQDDKTNSSAKKRKQKKLNKESEKELTSKADKEIEMLVTKQARLKERYLITPHVTYDDFGGITEVIHQIKKILLHLRIPMLYKELGIQAPRGLLLHGPPGVGKTMLVEAIAHDLKISCIKCGATEIIAGVSGESEEKIRELFNLAKSIQPCILFIDEIDAITPKREQAAREMERRIVTQLLTCLDNLNSKDELCSVIVISATNRPDAIDPALRRAGRFDKELALGIPDEKARSEILKVLCKNVKLDNGFDFDILAHKTPGYVGADLKNLIREAAINSLDILLTSLNIQIDSINELDFETLKTNHPDLLSKLFLNMSDFDKALKHIQPSAKREGFATIPDITWDDVGALKNIREEMQLSILVPIKYHEDVKTLGLTTSVGILLCGPPGCGKTLLAKAIANESGINFISVKGPELLNMYVGESERAVRSVFNRARDSKPCVIFFDEIDALCPKRSETESSQVTSRVVNQLLTEMDGLEPRSCFLLAATNRPDILDPAILRPGRFDKIIYVDFPSAEERYDILKTLSKNGTKPQFDSDVNIELIANDQRLEGYTGADLHSLLREASLLALKQKVKGEMPKDEQLKVKFCHLEEALCKLKPSVSEIERKKYEKLKSNLRIDKILT